MIRDRDAEVRIAAWNATHGGIVAAKAAGKLPEEKDKTIREALAKQFQSETPEIRTVIISEAGKDKAAVEASVGILVKQIETGTPEMKAAALRVLGKGGEAAAGQISHDCGPSRRIPMRTSARQRSPHSVRSGRRAVKANIPAIAQALLDDSDLVRDEALLALPAGGEALRNFPFKARDVFPSASPGVRATLLKALPIVVAALGMDDDGLARARCGSDRPKPRDSHRDRLCYFPTRSEARRRVSA